MIIRPCHKWDFLFFDLPVNSLSRSEAKILISMDPIVNWDQTYSTSLRRKQQLKFGRKLPRMYLSTNSNFLRFSCPLSTPMCSDDRPPKISTMQYYVACVLYVSSLLPLSLERCLCEFLEVQIVAFFLIHFYVDLPTGPHFNLDTKIVELYIESVFSGRYWLVFLGIYHTDTKGNLGRYILVSFTYFYVSISSGLRTKFLIPQLWYPPSGWSPLYSSRYCTFDLNLQPPNWGQIHRDFWWVNQPILWLQGLVYRVN